MKKIIIVFILIASYGILLPQSMYDTYSGFTVSTTPVLPPSETHPALCFTYADTAAIHARRSINSTYSSLWTKITNNINSYKTKTASTQDENDRPRMAKYCAFGWLMNHDATAKSKAIEALLIAYDNVPRTSVASSFDKPYDEIYRGTWIQNYCEAYDWIKDQLTSSQDSTIRGKILREAELLRNNMIDSVRYAPRPHNHRSKPAYGLATAALTFSADSRASEWLQFALTQLNTVTKYQYSADGIYREGEHYNLYALVNGIEFLWHYKNVSGVDQFPAYKPVFENVVQIRFGRGWLNSFEDGYIKPFPTHMVASAYTSTATSLHSSAMLSEILQWNYFNTTIFESNYTGATNDVAWDIDEYLFYNSSIVQTKPDCSPSINLEWGQTVFRKSWNHNDAANRVLLFHGPAEADNHNHPDQLAIMFEAENNIMASACGYGPDGSSDPKRDTWYLQPFANNLITVDSLAPTDLTTNVGPTTPHFMVGRDFEYAEKHCDYSNNSNWTRGISFPHRNYWVVRDLARSTSSKTFRWYMHSRGTMTKSGFNARWTTPSDIYGSPAIFDLYAVSGNGASLTSRSGYISFWGNNEQSAPYVELNAADTVATFLSILYPRANGSAAPTVTNLSTSTALAFSIAAGSATDYHIAKKDYNLSTSGSISSDGLYGMVSLSSGAVQSYSTVEGTQIKHNGITQLTVNSRGTYSCSFENGSYVYFTAEGGFSDNSAHIKLPFAATAISEVRVNDVLSSYSVVSDSIIRISASAGQNIEAAATGDWSVASTWSTNAVPTSVDNVVIPSGMTVTVNASNCTGNDITVNGNLTYSNSTQSSLTVNGNLTVTSSGSFVATAKSTAGNSISHTLTIQGDLISSNAVDFRVGSGANPSSTICAIDLTLSGSTNSIINVGASSDFNSVTINKTGSARVLLQSGVTQNNNSTTAASTLTLTNGVIETGAYTWSVYNTSNSSISGGSQNSYFYGKLARGWASSGSVNNKFFPLGDNSTYRPAYFSNTSSAYHLLTVEEISGAANNGSSAFAGGIEAVSALRYYKALVGVLPGKTPTDFILTGAGIGYLSDDSVQSGNTDLRIALSLDERQTWTGYGPTNHTTTPGTTPTQLLSSATSLTVLQGANIYLALGRKTGGLNPLPVELIAFRAEPLFLSVKLSWSTATELNNSGFAVERKDSSGIWKQLAFIQGAGNSNSLKQYAYTDHLSCIGTYSYRLKQIDNDGQFTYSKEISSGMIAVPNSLYLSESYPNPFNPECKLEFVSPRDGNALLSVYNMLGEKVQTLFNEKLIGGTVQRVVFNAVDLPSGVYFARLDFEGKSLMRKMILMR